MSQTITQSDGLRITSHTLARNTRGTRDIDMHRRAPLLQHPLRVELVDTTHPAWADVMRAIIRNGDGHSLLLHDGGRLSARQTVLAAFVDDQMVGHLCFSVEPARSSMGRATVRARLDSFAVDDSQAGAVAETLLTESAEERARLMKCRGPRVEAALLCC